MLRNSFILFPRFKLTELSRFMGSTSAKLAPTFARSRSTLLARSSDARFMGKHLWGGGRERKREARGERRDERGQDRREEMGEREREGEGRRGRGQERGREKERKRGRRGERGRESEREK